MKAHIVLAHPEQSPAAVNGTIPVDAQAEIESTLKLIRSPMFPFGLLS